MLTEKNFSLDSNKEQEVPIIIRKSAEAPPEVKSNPFYDPEFWGRAYSPDDIYLPDSDEAISFAIASHEIGHLVAEGKRSDADLDNFEAVYAEEKRAWEVGWKYLQQPLTEYFENRPEIIIKIQEAFKEIKQLTMAATNLSRPLYSAQGTLEERREKFFSEQGEAILQIFEQIKKEKIGIKPDWEKFINTIRKAVEDILKDNDKGK